MSTLLLLNGPPGVGKSTLAQHWADSATRRCAVDLDRLRAHMAAPGTLAAMHAARREASALADAALASGKDVAVAQLCGRPEFPDELAGVAAHRGATFVEIMLLDSLSHLQRRLRHRAASDEAHHRLAAQGLDDAALAEFRAALVARAGAHPQIVVLECPEDQEAITLRAIEQIVTDPPRS